MRPPESFINQPVRSLQTMLRILAEDDPSLGKVIPDGFYGPQTRNAVHMFQRSRGIPATGVADLQTWERITSEHEPALVRLSPAEPLQILFDPGEVIRRGDDRVELYLIQAVLVAISEAYESVSRPEMTGILDEATADSIATFQYLAGLSQTGELDKVTWKQLARHYPLATNLRGTNKRIR